MATLILASCAAPQPKLDSSKLATVRTIAVAVPHRAHYSAASSSGPIVIPGAGVIAAAVGAAVSGGINASTDKKALTFDEVVSAKLGDTHFSRRFVDAVEAELRVQGYTVSEIDLSQEGLKTEFDRNTWSFKLTGPQGYKAADAILVANVGEAYFAPGPLNSFTRQINGGIDIYKADTLEPIFTKRLSFLKFTDPYSYATYQGIVDDLPHAIQGLDDAAMSLIPGFSASLSATRKNAIASGTQTETRAQ
ncbi:hypothetical protein [Pararobbsia alpina]|uniref:hypothetical protein n=1 Tax=Pararobbsia alpina TaxID=621374 RepID=UPI0039A55CE4